MPSQSPNRPTTVRLSPQLRREMESREAYFGLQSETVRTDLARYRALLRSTRARLRTEEIFTDNEQALIIDACNGVLFGERPQTLGASVADAIALEGLGQKWEVKPYAISEKLSSLTPAELAAVVDAAEEFWAAVARGEDRDPRGGLFPKKSSGNSHKKSL